MLVIVGKLVPDVALHHQIHGFRNAVPIELYPRYLQLDLPVEVKSSKRIRLAHLKHLEIFPIRLRETRTVAIVFHDTTQPHKVMRRIVALPVTTFL